MKIVNIMFGRNLGGIEQAFLDYNEALKLAGHEVLAISHPLAQINPQITGDVTYRSLNNFGKWDFICAFRLKRILKEFQPDATITHGNRALSLTHKAKKFAGLHIGVTHNYKLKQFDKLDLIFATTKDLRRTLSDQGISLAKVVRIPNMIKLPERSVTRQEKAEGQPLIIGTMGRFVAKKGFDQLIEAVAKLSVMTRTPFKVVIGGDGEEKSKLQRFIKKHKLQDTVELIGWVNDKAEFYSKCDIFCLPSLHEPFGIVLLESMAYGTPIVAYESEGAKEIFSSHPQAGVTVPLGNVGALAEALSRLLGNAAQRKFLADQSRIAVQDEYAITVVSHKIDAALRQYTHS